MRRRAFGGFTLVEMMIVVVILGILATIASVGFRRYIARARTSEAVVMLAEVVSRENVYFTEFAHYIPIRKDNKAVFGPTASGGNGATTGDGELANAFHPKDPSSSPVLDSPRNPVLVNPLPQSWQNAGIRPKSSQLFCTYFANAGLGSTTQRPTGTTPAPAGSIGAKLWGNVIADSAAPWFYGVAICNLKMATNDTASWANQMTSLALGSNSPTLATFNEGQ